jgi:tRNA wybutosine-synthesizing protein 3
VTNTDFNILFFFFLQLSCGVQAGFRNSGISLKSRKNSNQEWPKIIVAIRSTHGIEAPLSTGGKLLVTSEVINLRKLINQ